MELFAHNQTAYEVMTPMLEACRRAAVIHPTGTGKSFLAFQLIEDHPNARFLWLSPNDYIFENQRRNADRAFPNVEFMTYTKLLRISEEALGVWVAGQRKARTGEGKGNHCLRHRSTSLRPSVWSGTAPSIPSGRVPTPGRGSITGKMGI